MMSFHPGIVLIKTCTFKSNKAAKTPALAEDVTPAADELECFN